MSNYSTGAATDCLEAAWAGGAVYVRNSKLGAASPVQHWPVVLWLELLHAVRESLSYSGVDVWGDGVRLGLARHQALVFTPDEWDAFVLGVRAGEFDPHILSIAAQPADSPAGRGQSATSEAERSLRTDQPGPSPVAGAGVVGGVVTPASPAFAAPAPAAVRGPVIPAEVCAAMVDLVRPDFLTGVDVDDWAREWAGAAFAAGVLSALKTAVDDADAWAEAIKPLVRHVPDHPSTAPGEGVDPVGGRGVGSAGSTVPGPTLADVSMAQAAGDERS